MIDMNKHVLVTLTVVLFIAYAAPAVFPAPGTITFQIPMELKDIHPDLQEWRVLVQVTYLVPTQGIAINGSAIQPFSIKNGTFNQMLNIVVNVPDMSKAEMYTIRLEIKDPTNGMWLSAKKLFNKYPKYALAPAKPFVWQLDQQKIHRRK